ncbi:MAG: VOC family protein [Anaerolineae bacterium]|nr:VOC family protein [Thermoflexales bacterium]MDW8406185.1 VOC family protein [Anaerolineae bacterium]
MNQDTSNTSFRIHPLTRIGSVHLRVSTFHRTVPFYTDVLGLGIIDEAAHRLTLGVETEQPLIVLEETIGAIRKPARTTGLYHFAILVPSRIDLARLVMRFVETEYPVQGASDHGVSEALYLADPDGNGIEVYADRPSDAWPREDGKLRMTTDPLDMAGLLNLLGTQKEAAGLPAGTRIGHIHLHVGHLAEAEAFYRERLGFDLMQRYGNSAAFLSAGGYHHHIGINTWAGVGAPPPPAQAVGLRHFTVHLPNRSALHALVDHLRRSEIVVHAEENGERIADPSGNHILLTAAEA